VIDAGAGNDTVNAGAGDDVIYQQDVGYDIVDGGDGNDRLVLDYSGETTAYGYPGRGIWVYYYDAGRELPGPKRGGRTKSRRRPTPARWGIHSYGYRVTYSGIEQLEVTGHALCRSVDRRWRRPMCCGAAAGRRPGGGWREQRSRWRRWRVAMATTPCGRDSNPQQIDGGAGTDRLVVDLSGFGGDLVWINDPTQTVTLANGLTVIGIEALTLTTGAGNDEIAQYAGGTSDTLSSGDGNDVIDAGGGNDTVNAGAGDDVIYQKDAGSDVVDGGEGNDRLVLDYSGEATAYGYPGRGMWVYYYDAEGNYLNRSGGLRSSGAGQHRRGGVSQLWLPGDLHRHRATRGHRHAA
jgi:Ca2+-binding RTX toxin-like protein